MPNYLDDAQHAQLDLARSTWRWRSEWPTWLLIPTIYGAWFGIASNAQALGLPLAVALLAVASAWYMSLQHELMHGHPTRYPTLNAALGCAPLAAWFPYGLYREAHLAHHDAAPLGDPNADPESYFVDAQAWQSAGACMRTLLHVRATLLGRMLLGPAFTLASTAHDACRRVARGDLRQLPMWCAHWVALAALVGWLEHRCGISPSWFFMGVAYPALSIATLRSFHEHRATADPAQRSVLNEAAWPWRLLFLNNNYHAVHHDLPSVPWFELPRVYRQRRDDYRRQSGDFVVRGYGEWVRRFAFRRIADVVYPANGHHAVVSMASSPASAASQMPLDLVATCTLSHVIDDVGQPVQTAP
jgi:fatty acid desaturase